MTVGEIIHKLVNTPNYEYVRTYIPDDFICFVRENLPSDYDLFREKEEKYQLDKLR